MAYVRGPRTRIVPVPRARARVRTAARARARAARELFHIDNDKFTTGHPEALSLYL